MRISHGGHQYYVVVLTNDENRAYWTTAEGQTSPSAAPKLRPNCHPDGGLSFVPGLGTCAAASRVA